MFVSVCLGSLVWAAAAFVLLDPILTGPLRDMGLSMAPAYFKLGDYIHRPQAYTSELRIATWCLMLASSLIVPTLEELYFRGMLLPRMERYGRLAPVLSALLFSLYHFWSPWMLPVRVVAILPYVWFTYRYRSVWIGIVVHVSLNLIGDVILVIPAVFS